MEQQMTCRSCMNCGTVKCNTGNGNYPEFCLTTGMPEEEKAVLFQLYEEPENHSIMVNAAQLEYDGYCRLSRVEETIEFAKRMGFKKLGIATCAGLIRESQTLARILRANGFEVYGVACKAGAINKTQVGIAEECEAIGCHMCNPVFQARQLNRQKTELNIVVGLCVGHDSLFYKYAEAITTTIVVKDRVTGHNPAAVLYMADGYYKAKLYPNNQTEQQTKE